jgi:hypothetical protein
MEKRINKELDILKQKGFKISYNNEKRELIVNMGLFNEEKDIFILFPLNYPFKPPYLFVDNKNIKKYFCDKLSKDKHCDFMINFSELFIYSWTPNKMIVDILEHLKNI